MFMTPSVISALIISLTSFPNRTEADYRYHVCSNRTTFTPNSIYQSNLNILLSSLSSNATRDGGFYNTTVGSQDSGTDVVYGSFLCRGDLTPGDCRSCVETARDVVQRNCPVEKVAVIWYDECMLRYSNASYFGKMDVAPGVYLWNIQNITDPDGRFNQLVGDTMNTVIRSAASAEADASKIKYFAKKEANFSAFQTLYTLAQCTPDISKSDCNICLGEAVGRLPICCTGKQGGRVLFPSCNVRFETYQFYNIDAAPPPPVRNLPPPPPPPPASSTASQGNGKISPTTIIAICAPIAVVLLVISVICFWRKRRVRDKYKAIQNYQNAGSEIVTVESLQFDLGTIRAATNNFSDDNKLGEGGFGAVYKGTLLNQQEIAVKRLSRSSAQGAEEFKNEVVVVARLQHRNLTRLLGFCLEGEEKILVYEYVPNKSLDNFLFDQPANQAVLDWSRRYKVINGIARGILYLHEDSRLRIIHRDLKSSNILLDQEMNPKISDFGMAKICGVDQTQGNTSRIVGTYGYMAPEYAFYGHFSVKSDIYSFGVLIMEIITGKKNTRLLDSESSEDLLSNAWKHWRGGTALELLDPRLRDSYTANEVMRCIHIGLLCVQEDAADRPTMASIVLMLSSYSITLPIPQKPAFFPYSGTEGNMPSVETESDKSSRNISNSVNEMSYTEVYPR
ncbi:Cysteine rich receptor like kinase [Trema orientale]|uniref:Cysteine rich receptor like kinase n=1 Tax=Trema orientale TaxID=63057 RepID=A0A2P5ERJ0_TREOI|nr:Cysteine rich receptor like kinase [Trema orientale]